MAGSGAGNGKPEMVRHCTHNRAIDIKRKVRKRAESTRKGNYFGQAIIKQMGMLQALLVAHFTQTSSHYNKRKNSAKRSQWSNRPGFWHDDNSRNKREVRCFFCYEVGHKKNACVQYKHAKIRWTENKGWEQDKSIQHYHTKPDVLTQKREKQEVLTVVQNGHKQENEGKYKGSQGQAHLRQNIKHDMSMPGNKDQRSSWTIEQRLKSGNHRAKNKAANAGIFSCWESNNRSNQSCQKTTLLSKKEPEKTEKANHLGQELKVENNNLQQEIDALKMENNMLREIIANDPCTAKGIQNKNQTAIDKGIQTNRPTTIGSEEMEMQKQTVHKLKRLLVTKEKEWIDREQWVRQQTEVLVGKINVLEAQNEQLSCTIKEKNAEWSNVHNQTALLQTQLTEAKTIVDCQERSQEASIAEMKKREAELEQKTKAMEAMQNQLERLKPKLDEIATLRKENQKLTMQIDTVEEQLRLETIRSRELEDKSKKKKKDMSERMERNVEKYEALLRKNKADEKKLQEELKETRIQLQEEIKKSKQVQPDKTNAGHHEKKEKPSDLPWHAGQEEVYAELSSEQNHGESLAHFAARVHIFAEQLRANASDEHRENIKTFVFQNGIQNRDVRDELEEQRPQTLQEAFKLAQEIEEEGS